MERIRRTLPIAVLAGMSIAVGLPFILASRETPSSSLPITSWGALISVTSRSLVIPMVSALIAAVLAAAIVLFGYGVCARSIRRILFALSAIPFLFPPVIVAHAVHQWLGEPNLLFSSSLTVLPVAVAGQALALRFIDADTLMLTRNLGLASLSSWRLAVLPAWAKGATLAWMWGVFQLFSDPGIYEMYGGHESYLASHILRSVSGGSPGPSVVRASILMLVPTVIMAFTITRQRFWRGTVSGRLVPQERVSDLLSQFRLPLWLSAIAGLLVLGCLATIFATVMTIAKGAATSAQGSMPPTASIIPTIILIAVAVPVSAVGALVLSMAIVHSGAIARSYGYFLVAFMVFTSPTAIGALLTASLRVPVVLGDTTVIPAIVGGGSTAGGWIGLFLAAVAVCMPMSTLLLLGLFSLRASDSVAVARDLGAGPMRVLMTVEFPYVMPIAIASLCVETSALFTNLSPLVFVAPGGMELATPQLLTLAISGQSNEAFALAMLTGLMTLGAIVGIGALVTVIVDSATNTRNWRRV